MNFWEFLHRLGPGWNRILPTERQWAVMMTWGLGVGMLVMTIDRPQLWREELFKTLITVVMITGFVNLILGFYFAANKSDEVKAENTGEAFRAIAAAAKGGTTGDEAAEGAQDATDAAQRKTDELSNGGKP